MTTLNLTRTARFLPPFAGRPYDRTGPDETADAIKILRALHAEPDPADAVNFTDELEALDRIQREIEQIAIDFGPVSAADLLYGECEPQSSFNPADHIPADPTVMSQKGWVCNSKRAAIKAAYEKQLHDEYNGLWKGEQND